MNRIALLGLLIPGALTLTTGCGSGDSPTGTGGSSSGTGGSGSSGTGGSGSGSSGATTGSDGTGATGTGGAAPTPGAGAGIQGCVAMFVEADGLCHPTLDKCPKGSIPRFDQGCVPVGIAGCSSTFLEADGLCHVTMSKCLPGTFAVPSEGCVPIDGPAGCGAAPWGAIADGASTIWVDPTYAGGSNDGSKAKPVTTIAEGLALAPEGGRVALAAGSYAEAVLPKKSVEIVGRCPSLVKISGVAAFGASTAIVGIGPTPAGVTLRNVQIGGAGQGIAVEGAAMTKATIDGVWVKNATEFGLSATAKGAIVDVKHSLFQGTLSTPDGGRGEGIIALQGGTVVVEASASVDNLTNGVGAYYDGSKLTFTDGLIEGTTSRKSDGLGGHGVLATATATATISGSAVVSNHYTGVAANGAGSAVDVSGSVIEKTKPQKVDSSSGVGFAAEAGASATIKGSAVLDNLLEGVSAFGQGSDTTVDQTLVAGTTPQLSDGNGGNGIYALDGGALHISRSTVVGNSNVGILTQIKGASAQVTSSLVQANGGPGAFLPAGIAVDLSSSATIDNSALVDNVGVSVIVVAGASVVVKHALVEGTLPDSKGNNGVGVLSTGATFLQISASALLSNQAVGVLAQGPLAMSGSVVRGVKLGRIAWKSIPTIDGIGDGVVVVPGAQFSADATITGSLFEDCGRAGILFASRDGSIHGAKATKNRFGLVIQGAPIPDVGADNAFVGNTEKDQVDGGMLPVP